MTLAPTTHSSIDKVTLVNESDEVIGEMDKIEAHRRDGKLHRASSVYLFRKRDNAIELLIQKRAAIKIVGAHQWANTICGNVRPTESYEQCAYRRLREELGITQLSIQPVYKFLYHLKCGVLTEAAKAAIKNRAIADSLQDNEEFSEWEMDQVFFGWYDKEVSPNPDEAQDFSWVKWDTLLEKSAKAEKKLNEFRVKNIEINNIQMTLAPWFVWMLEDEELVKIMNNSFSL